MKQVFDCYCDYCGSHYTVKMHKAAFDRCSKSVCERQECHDKNTAEIDRVLKDEKVQVQYLEDTKGRKYAYLQT